MDKRKREIPSTLEERNALRMKLADFVRARALVPPLRIDELREAVDTFVAESGAEKKYSDWLAVILNNEAWRGDFTKTPPSMRVLLLPQCLRSHGTCAAKFDDIGLLCESCGACPINFLQNSADSLDMVSIVTDSTSAVERLIEEGSVSAVLGVSCMDSLERSFPRTLKHGVAGIAIPLLRDGCKNTEADIDWILEAMNSKADGFSMPSDAEIRNSVSEIFTRENISKLLDSASSDAAFHAAETLSAGGNRWRPRLLVAAYFAMTESDRLPDAVKNAAFAVECFHKASLIHDDIEDEDDTRDGVPSLNAKIGVPRAVNVGDFLLGAGYEILCGCGDFSIKLLQSAAMFHKILAVGQGEELAGKNRHQSIGDIIEIYAQKTGGAFSAALDFAAICAGMENELSKIFLSFSRNLGIAYQIYDDIRDFANEESSPAVKALKVKANPPDGLKILYEEYRAKTYASLSEIKKTPIKRLLFAMTGKMLKDA